MARKPRSSHPSKVVGELNAAFQSPPSGGLWLSIIEITKGSTDPTIQKIHGEAKHALSHGNRSPGPLRTMKAILEAALPEEPDGEQPEPA